MMAVIGGACWPLTGSSLAVSLLSFFCNRPFRAGKLVSEEETKEEFKLERDPPATHEEGAVCRPGLETRLGALITALLPSSLTGSNSSVKMPERSSNARDKERERDKEKVGGSEGAGAGGAAGKEAEKRKRSRTADKLQSSSNPASPGGAKRRRT